MLIIMRTGKLRKIDELPDNGTWLLTGHKRVILEDGEAIVIPKSQEGAMFLYDWLESDEERRMLDVEEWFREY